MSLEDKSDINVAMNFPLDIDIDMHDICQALGKIKGLYVVDFVDGRKLMDGHQSDNLPFSMKLVRTLTDVFNEFKFKGCYHHFQVFGGGINGYSSASIEAEDLSSVYVSQLNRTDRDNLLKMLRKTYPKATFDGTNNN